MSKHASAQKWPGLDDWLKALSRSGFRELHSPLSLFLLKPSTFPLLSVSSHPTRISEIVSRSSIRPRCLHPRRGFSFLEQGLVHSGKFPSGHSPYLRTMKAYGM
ncbi:hypothetical protein PGT21_028220 [Puccinia graminis f. sp. tritici]|uniref:Uncharacterized protein n=1 Tax=Puccinia graminis f. sp. tritici TaxID=56615 RepID=A0A5B0M8G1_PUCGR|nr:hypothetical protein PGT21_028220 [Puccinia graminis f. sp. tritici]